MAVFQDYTSGTVSVANGETTVTGDSTAWSMADIRAGDTFMRAGFVVAIASVDSDTSLTLSEPWPGTTLAGSEYRIRYQPDGSRYTAAARALIEQLGESALAAFADLEGAENTLPFFTGPDAMDLTALTPYARTLLAATAASGALDELGVSAFIQTLLDDADAEAARQTLGADDASNLTQGTIPPARVANLPADKAYRQGNILGSVSESGGVPTGALIERGSNANGEYVRWADGTQICLCTVTLTFGGTNILDGQVTFPAVFSSSDYVAVPMVTSFVRSKDEALGSLWYPNNISTTGIGARLASDGHFSSGDNAIVNVSVIGRWF